MAKIEINKTNINKNLNLIERNFLDLAGLDIMINPVYKKRHSNHKHEVKSIAFQAPSKSI